MVSHEPLRAWRKPRENQYIFNLGVKGRKTGLTLPDTGIRDENGLEPMDHLFSSPEKSAVKGKRDDGSRINANATISSDDMDMGESTVPEPTAVLKARQSLRMPPPRSKSPIKTFLQSPARRNPSLGPVSSPVRGSIVTPKSPSVTTSVRRKLDFSTDDVEGKTLELSTTSRPPQKRARLSNTKVSSKLTNGTKHSTLKSSPLSHEDEMDDSAQIENDVAIEYGGDSSQVANGGGDGDDEIERIEEQTESDREPEPEPRPPKKGRARSKTNSEKKAMESVPQAGPEIEVEVEVEVEAEPEPEIINKGSKGRGRPRKASTLKEDLQEPPAKRIRHSLEGAEHTSKPAAKTRSNKSTKALPKAKATTKRPKLATVAEAESPDIQRGPPLPRNNRGLFILRRETPMDGTAFKQSRYGRNSVKPVAWWKNERIEYSDDEAEDGSGKFLLSRIKEVVRKDEVEDTRSKRTYQKLSKGKAKKGVAPEESEDEAEPWEADPGRIYGEVRQWDPEDQFGAEAQEEEQEIAWSSAAIISKDVKDATFKFAKCISMPFFGAGILDLPIGAMKKPKNSRTMQMAFFVYTGRVQVTVNGSNPFRVSKGGMWQVPRGNFYSIYNDSDKPSRLFFSQGCEIEEAKLEYEE